MGFLNKIKDEWDKNKAAVHNKGELRKVDTMFKGMDDFIENIESLPPEIIVNSGQGEKFYKDFKNIIARLEDSIYKSAIATFCASLEGHKIRCPSDGDEEHWKQIDQIICKYKEITRSDTFVKHVSRTEYDDFLNALEEFSDKYPKWFGDGRRMITIQKQIEDSIKLKLMEERFEAGKKRIENYIGKLGQKEEYTTKVSLDASVSFDKLKERTKEMEKEMEKIASDKKEPLKSFSAYYFANRFGVPKEVAKTSMEKYFKKISAENKERKKSLIPKLEKHKSLLENFAIKYMKLAPCRTGTFGNSFGKFDANFLDYVVDNEKKLLDEDLIQLFYKIDLQELEKLICLLSAKYDIDTCAKNKKKILPSFLLNVKMKEFVKAFSRTKKQYERFIERYVKYFGEKAKHRENIMTFVRFLQQEKLLPPEKTQEELRENVQRLCEDIQDRIKKELYDSFEKALTSGKERSLKDIDKMNGRNFEEFICDLFKEKGYKAINTVYSNDQGADLILKKFGKSIAVQAKRYGGKVSNKAVQEIVTAQKHYKCDEAWIVTNSHLTRQAKALAKSNGVRVIEREELKKML